MLERRAQVILLVRAFEEVDTEGLVLPLKERAQATRRALMVTGLGGESRESARAWGIRSGEAVLRRARLLLDCLLRRHAALGRLPNLAQLGASTAPVVLLVGFLLGLGTNALGLERRIHLLSIPLLGLLAWNLAVYLALPVAAWLRSTARHSAVAELLCSLLFRGAIWRRRKLWDFSPGTDSLESRIIAKAVVRFAAMWHRLAAPLLTTRLRRTLHLAALATVAGVVVGMYVRGLAFEYRVTWESTWLDAPAMQAILDRLLGPASWVTGIEVPSVAPLRAPSSGEAAPWIHLYAWTALLFVGAPRLALAGWMSWQAGRLARDLPLDLHEPYFQKMFSRWRGASRRVRIVPYSLTVRSQVAATLRTLLFDFFGARADVRIGETVSYGDEPEASDDSEAMDTCLVVLFNLAQSPEPEVHGLFLRELKERLDPKRSQLLVLLDSSGYRKRAGDGERIEERVQAWNRMLADLQLTAVELELDRQRGPRAIAERVDAAEQRLHALREALWPGEQTAGGLP